MLKDLFTLDFQLPFMYPCGTEILSEVNGNVRTVKERESVCVRDKRPIVKLFSLQRVSHFSVYDYICKRTPAVVMFHLNV